MGAYDWLRTAARRAAAVALEARAVPHHGEIAAFRAAFALVPLHLRFYAPISEAAFWRDRRLDMHMLMNTLYFLGSESERRRADRFCRLHLQRMSRQGGSARHPRHQHNVGQVLLSHETPRHHPARRYWGRSLAIGDPPADRIEADVGGLDMGEVMAPEIGDRELTEDVVDDRRRVLDRVIALYLARRLEAGEGGGLDIFRDPHAILEPHRHCDGEIVHHRPQSRTFLVHVDEDLPQAAVLIFAGMKIDLVV